MSKFKNRIVRKVVLTAACIAVFNLTLKLTGHWSLQGALLNAVALVVVVAVGAVHEGVQARKQARS